MTVLCLEAQRKMLLQIQRSRRASARRSSALARSLPALDAQECPRSAPPPPGDAFQNDPGVMQNNYRTCFCLVAVMTFGTWLSSYLQQTCSPQISEASIAICELGTRHARFPPEQLEPVLPPPSPMCHELEKFQRGLYDVAIESSRGLFHLLVDNPLLAEL